MSWYEVYLLDERFEYNSRLDEMEWVRLSHLEASIYNIMRDTKKKPSPFTPEDFYLPSWKKKEEKVEVEEQDVKEKPKKWEDLLKLVEEKKRKKLDNG